MKKENGNMYEWAKPWNPLGGECPHKCGYCSTQSLMRYPGVKAKYSGPLKLYDEVLRKCPATDKTIFVVGQNDLFAKEVPSEWILKVLQGCKAWENVYLFQSKNPERFIEFRDHFPPETILCTTIESNRKYDVMGPTPHPRSRSLMMSLIRGFTKQVTIEPVIDFDLEEMVALIKRVNPVSVNIGADSKGHNLPEPSREKLLALIDELKKFTVIDQKRNLTRLLK